MKYCKYCGKELADNERCSCADSVKRTKMIKMGAVIAGAVILIVVLAILIASTVTRSEEGGSSNNSSEGTGSAFIPSNGNATTTGTTTPSGNSQKIDPFEFLGEPVFSGLDGYGKASIYFDKDALIESIIGEEPDNFFGSEYKQWLALYEEYAENIVCEYPTGNLSNYDVYEVQIHVSGIASEKITGGGRSFIVEGLTEVQQIDFLQYVVLNVQGVSGDASASVILDSGLPLINYCRFTVYPRSGLKNGDVVTVTINNANWLLQQYAVAPTELSKQFVVSGLDTYATAEDLPMDVVWSIAKQFAAEKQAEIGNDDGESMWVSTDVIVAGIYFAEYGEPETSGYSSVLHILISYDEYYRNGEFFGTYCHPLTFRNITMDVDGNINISYEDGSGSFFFYDSVEEYLEGIDGDYTVTKVG